MLASGISVTCKRIATHYATLETNRYRRWMNILSSWSAADGDQYSAIDAMWQMCVSGRCTFEALYNTVYIHLFIYSAANVRQRTMYVRLTTQETTQRGRAGICTGVGLKPTGVRLKQTISPLCEESSNLLPRSLFVLHSRFVNKNQGTIPYHTIPSALKVCVHVPCDSRLLIKKHSRCAKEADRLAIIMSKKRPGVAAAIRLCQSTPMTNDDDLPLWLWEKVEAQWDDVLESMPKGQGTLLNTHHQKAQQLGEQLRRNTTKTNAFKAFLTKQELLEVVIPWKFAVGKPRPALWKHLRSNTEESVVQCTAKGISLARNIPPTTGKKNEKTIQDDDIKSAIQALTQLQGVGPATASVILSLVRPDVFAYMFDEVIDCFLPQRTYTLAVYLDSNRACQDLAERLEWTAARVAQTLWIAARACAAETVEDFTLSVTKQNKKELSSDDAPKVNATEEESAPNGSRQSKRRKKR
eukprot:scaffold2716_cov179-Amphora_coffeaeformis.AAC.18